MSRSTLLAVGLLACAGAIAHTPNPPAHRSGASVKVTAVGEADLKLEGWTQAGGKRAYGLVVPPGGQVTVRLRHAKAAYFHVSRKVVHNLGYAPDKCLSGEPMNCFNNATKQPIDVYFIVSDPEHWADDKSPYTLEFTRSWKPGADTGGVKLRDELDL